MKKKPAILFYLLGGYVILQFSWWTYYIIRLTKELDYTQIEINKRIGMIIGEGMVFFIILIFGLWRIMRSIKKEYELSKRQHNFLLSVTHELKTPLASIKLYLQTLLKHDFEPEKREELLTKAVSENLRLEEIVEAMLISARIENHTLEIHKEKINITKEINKIIKQYDKKFNKEIIDLLFIGIKNNEEIILETDLFMFKTIVMNLIENAIKYGGVEQQIKIELEKKDQHLILRIADFGPGIPKDQREVIFEKFVRLENEETRSKKGAGLGLFIVKEFTKLIGAEIIYKENKPKGAIFEITF